MRFHIILAVIITIFFIHTPNAYARWDLVLLTTSGLNGQMLPAREKNDQNSEGMVRTFGGFARIQSIFKSYRAKYPGLCLTVATGDDLMGESLTNKQGKTVFGAMNMMGFDVSTLGNHEFDRGSKFLMKCLSNKNFPTIVSNLNVSKSNKLNKYIQPHIIITKNFLNVGIMGMILPELKLISNPGTGISVYPDIIKSARNTARELKKQGANIIILLSHLSLKDQQQILEEIPEIDVICGGQSHKDILPGQELIARDALSPGLMVQCGNQGRFIGVMKLKFKNGFIDQHEWTIIPVTDQIKDDPEMLKFLQAQFPNNNSGEMLAQSPGALDTRVSLIRTREAPVGRLVSSIMRERFSTDIAFQNSGGIRGNKVIPAGPVTGKDINKMFPFGNTITILKVTGKQLKQILERSVHKLPETSGAFLQTSGLQYALDPTARAQELEINQLGKPIRIKTAGNRISEIKVMDKTGRYHKIKVNDVYSITTNSYLANGGDGYLVLKEATGRVDTFIKVRDVIKFGLLDMKTIKIDSKPVIFNQEGKPYFN